MHRNMMMMRGKQLQFESLYGYEPTADSNLTSGTVASFSMDEEDLPLTTLPPKNTNPSSKGVPLLWTPMDHNTQIQAKSNPTGQRRQLSVLASSSHSDDIERETKPRYNTWHHSSFADLHDEDEKPSDTDAATVPSSDKFDNVTMQDILLSHPMRQVGQPSAAAISDPSTRQVFISDEKVEDEYEPCQSQVTRFPRCQSARKKFRDENSYFIRTDLLYKLRTKLEFNDRNKKDTNELIDRGLNLTRMMQEATFNQLPYTRPPSFRRENRVKSAVNYGHDSDYQMVKPDPTLLAAGSTSPIYYNQVYSSPSTKLSRSKTPPPGNLLRCLRHNRGYDEKRPNWRY